jgi:uncharacterized protein (DUF952 family)
MQDDLIFHLVDKENWKTNHKKGEYSPESIEQEGFIHCSSGPQLNDTLKRLFKNNQKLWLLIIDTKRVEPVIKYEKSGNLQQAFPHIYGSLNTDAILDKISLKQGEGEHLSLNFSTN